MVNKQKGVFTMTVEEMRKAGYLFNIIGNDGYQATLVGCQPLLDGDWCAVYRYPGGDCVHGKWEILNCFQVVEW